MPNGSRVRRRETGVDTWTAYGSERVLGPSIVTWATPSSLRRNRDRDRTVSVSAGLGPRLLCYVMLWGGRLSLLRCHAASLDELESPALPHLKSRSRC